MSNLKRDFAREAEKGAAPASKGLCMRYVANALRRALGEQQGVAGYDAKDGAPFFTKRGFEEVEVDTYETGDVVIFDVCPGHQDGHVQVNSDGVWISDFKQKGFYPYKDGSKPSFSVYRYQQ